MFAVVDIAGQQFKVEEKEMHYVPRLDAEPDSKLTFENVLVYSDGKTTSVGNPTVGKITVEAKVLSHLQDDKVIVFKKKRRKSYKLTKGHRQHLTKIEITKIG